ncbi:MAG: ABC transporter permease [Ignavibacteriales bacterium]|jgi:ABC-2 type transport system permease protein|nr:ABC transporter permease [Ignavibacteriaceae bacterium]NLH60133.1 ABC transporter permease [Ignavibacteriales bacterium]HOJ17251.1 ABC transporter permease [Ignavibacteriaceae bacterium]HPO54440.1 ABC transporter permease [Ignavibacteriaceae bacterium]
MKKFLVIAKWEFLEKLRTKAFIISLFVTPLILFLFSYLPGKLANEEDQTTKPIGLIDSTGQYTIPLTEKLSSLSFGNNQPRYLVLNLAKKDIPYEQLKSDANEKVLAKKIDGYIYIKYDSLAKPVIEYRSRSVGNFHDLDMLEATFNEMYRQTEFRKYNLDPALVSNITKKIEIKSIKVEEEGKESKTDFYAKFMTSYIFIILLMITIISSGGMLIRSLVEEKSNRLIEILVSSCSANDMLAGKVLGLSLLSLFQVAVWIVLAVGFAGASLATMINLDSLLLVLVYFMLGFVLYTSLFVGLGSVVTTEQEAQMLTSYLSLVILLPIIIAMPIMQNPDLLLAQIFSYFPLTSPAIMILRLNNVAVPAIEIIITVGILILSIYITILFSAKIFRIGILSYGKRPGIKEIISWLRKE